MSRRGKSEREKLLWSARKLARWRSERKARGERIARVGYAIDTRGAISVAGRRGPLAIGRERVEVPRCFSLLDDPEQAIRFLSGLRSKLNRRDVQHIHIDHSNCESIDLSASAVMDALVTRARSARGGSTRLQASGTFSSRSLAVNLLLRAIGIVHRLSFEASQLPQETERHIERLEVFSGKSKRLESAPNRDEATTRITEYFSRCLQRTQNDLSDEGKSEFSKLISEVIGNAEEHTGGTWSTVGFWADSSAGAGECQLVIFNFGKTIFESLGEADATSSVRCTLKQLSDLHSQRGFFNRGWDEETLWTLYALQEGVSRFGDGAVGQSRGRGTIEMIRAFQQLAAPETRAMCVLSGRSYILFNKKYDLGAHNGLRRIAFNSDNDFGKPPDRDCVRTLPDGFPGTVVGVRLTLDQGFIRAIGEAGNEGN